MEKYIFSDLTGKIINAALEVHSNLGPGMLESAYQECLFFELGVRGIVVKKQVPVPLVYKNIKLDCGYRLDLLVENKIVLELKSVDAINEIYLAQLATYLKFSGCRLGLLINFNVKSLKTGIRRIIL